MKCEACPFVLACWSGTFRPARCKGCKRLILDSHPEHDVHDTAEFIVVENCEGRLDDVVHIMKIEACPVCGEGRMWRKHHVCHHDAAGYRFVLSRIRYNDL